MELRLFGSFWWLLVVVWTCLKLFKHVLSLFFLFFEKCQKCWWVLGSFESDHLGDVDLSYKVWFFGAICECVVQFSNSVPLDWGASAFSLSPSNRYLGLFIFDRFEIVSIEKVLSQSMFEVYTITKVVLHLVLYFEV